MKPIAILLTAVLSTTAFVAAQNAPDRGRAREAVVKAYDANKNGKLDDAERATILKEFDANKDGKLDRDERLTVAKSVANKQDRKTNEGHGSSQWNTVGFQQANTMGAGKADIPNNGKFRVFVLMGQSNMHGTARAAELKPPYTEKHDRIRIWANGRWEYYVPRNRFGPGVSMAHQLAARWPEDTIGIIKIASGGTGICGFEKNWTKESADRTFDGRKGSLYKDLMHAVAEAGKISKPVYSGFVWKQGGADGTRKDLADEYYETFRQLVSDLRKDLATPDLPVFVLTYASDEDLAKATGDTGKRKFIRTVLAAHNRAGRDISNTTVVHHGKLPVQKDGVHFNHEGQVKLGKMTADAVSKAYDANKDGKPGKPRGEASTGHQPSTKLPYASIKHTLEDWVPVKRTTEQIVRVAQDTNTDREDTWKLDFYRNMAYKCGLSGNHTFLVIEPRNAAGKKAPLWVYFHGGGNGHFDKDGTYRTLGFQDKDTYNHEEPFETLRLVNKGQPVFKDGRLAEVDTTLTRRVKEGYRLLVIGYGDHDQYSGMGTPYPNNPEGGEVNGLQASMSAVEYTVAHYPTTQVFAHGSSAGAAGAYALSFAFAQEGIDLTGVVMDSSINTPRRTPIGLAMVRNRSKIIPADALETIEQANKADWLGSYPGLVDKIGVMIDPRYPFYPEAAVTAGYRSIPMLVVAGKSDPFFGGKAPPIAEAKASGLGNVAWMFDGLRKAIDDQENSPHTLLVMDAGHVPTVKKPGHPVHDEVDSFIRRVTASRSAFPFENRAKAP